MGRSTTELRSVSWRSKPATGEVKFIALQTAMVAGASAFVGTYGGFSYLAPFLGVRSTAYCSDANGYSARHLLMTRSALESIGAGGLLDVRPTGLQELR